MIRKTLRFVKSARRCKAVHKAIECQRADISADDLPIKNQQCGLHLGVIIGIVYHAVLAAQRLLPRIGAQVKSLLPLDGVVVFVNRIENCRDGHRFDRFIAYLPAVAVKELQPLLQGLSRGKIIPVPAEQKDRQNQQHSRRKQHPQPQTNRFAFHRFTPIDKIYTARPQKRRRTRFARSAYSVVTASIAVILGQERRIFMDPLLRVRDLSLCYQTPLRETRAIDHISFDLREGEFVSIIGPSGCGKSTLLSAVAGLIPVSGGEILLEGKPRSAAFSVGYMLQSDCLFEWRTILQNVTLGLELRGERTAKAMAFARRLLQKYGLGDFEKQYPSQLSGGMRQRCALIRTLCVSPRLLLLDEAFSALDYQTKLAVIDDVYAILKSEGQTALIVTHDIAECISISDRIIVLTPRPARIKTVVDIRFADPDLTPFQRRNAPEFGEYFNRIWGEIDAHL